MRIKSVRIKNFRPFEDQTIELNQHTSIVGENGAGMSILLCAQNVSLWKWPSSAIDLTSLPAERLYSKNIKDPSEIAGEFTDMRKESQAEYRGCKLNAAHSRDERYTSLRHEAR